MTRRSLVRGAAVALALLLFAWTLRDLQFARAVRSLEELGAPLVLLAFVPQALALGFETLGWRAAFRQIGERPRFLALLWVRVAAESLALVVPGGAIVAEPAKVALLSRHAGSSLSASAAAVLLRKYLVLAAQSAWMAVAACLGYAALSAHAFGSVPGTVLVGVVVVAALALSLAAAAGRALLARGRLLDRLRGWLARLPLPASVPKFGNGFEAADGHLRSFFGAGARREGLAMLPFLLSWACESAETYLLLRLLGAELDFGAVAVIEVSVTLLKNLAFVLPAGLGVQDAGYALFLRALGVPNASELALAFTVLKRGRELAWIAFGLSLLGATTGAGRRRPDPAGAL